jgi:hypothetical protein
MEGTLAHELAELKLRLEFGKIKKASYTRGYKKIKASEFYSRDFELAVDEYVEKIKELFANYRVENGAAEIDFEIKTDFSKYVPQGFGTADCVIMSEPTLHVIDLKFGKGVEVSSEENSQLMLYALGAYLSYSLVYGFDQVAMTIIQPRLYNMSTYVLPVDELLKWAEQIVKPRAQKAFDGLGDFTPSEDGCRFCPAKAVCRARADEMNALVAKDFETEPAQLSSCEITELLSRTGEIASWCKDIENYALEQALAGEKYQGFKLVEGRSVRKITDEKAVVEALVGQGGYNIEDVQPRKLATLTTLEKLVGRAEFNEVCGNWVVKPVGSPTLVKESDKRPEFAPVKAEDFDI